MGNVREPTRGWERLIKINRLTDEQLKRIEQAYAVENEDLYQRYNQMSEEERLRWRYQRYIKDYLRVVRGMDDGIGRVMAWLERESLLDNTVVIYASDQGFFLGENGWFDKRWIYEESMRMPLIIHWPEGIEPNSTCKELVQNLDLAPTILDMADADIPSYMQGKSLLPLLKGETPSKWRDAVYYHYYEGPPAVHKVATHYGVRTDRYTLAHFYENDEWELFDLKADPEQLENVYNDPDYADVLENLKQKVKKLQQQYDVENTRE